MNQNEKIHSPLFFAYLMITAVLCGGFVMVVEVLGSRVIGPFFGVGLFVWTSLIAVALLSLALGYWLAGHWADKREHPDYLYGIIIVGGLLVLLIPFIKGALLQLCMPLGLRWGAFTSTLLLFGPPLFVLGCVSPYLIKIATKEFHLIGRTVGRFYALSTLGSTVGTTATGFFLITNFRVDGIFILSAAILMGIGALYFALFRKQFLPLLLLLLPVLLWPKYEPLDKLMEDGTRVQEIADRSSYYGHIKVIDYRYGDQHIRDMLIDGLTQGGVDMTRGVSLYEYSYLMEILPYGLYPDGKNALMIGLGAGLVPMWYEQRDVSVDVVEIDPVVAEVAKEFFDLKVSGDIHINDARYFLTTNQKHYDYVLMDVFNGDLTPGLLISQEAFTLVKNSLSEEGIFALNLIADIDGNTAGTHSVLKTLGTLFEHVDYYPVATTAKSAITNVIVVAYNGPAKSFDRNVFEHMVYYPSIQQNIMNSLSMPQRLAEPQREPIVLRDDYNPLDAWDMAIREEVRSNILGYQELELLIN